MMLQKLTSRANAAITEAAKLAMRRGDMTVGMLHTMYGLCHGGETYGAVSVARYVLNELGITEEAIVALLPPPPKVIPYDDPTEVPIPQELRDVIHRIGRHRHSVSPEGILWALVADGDPWMIEFLGHFGLRQIDVLIAIDRVVSSEQKPEPAESEAIRVARLEAAATIVGHCLRAGWIFKESEQPAFVKAAVRILEKEFR